MLTCAFFGHREILLPDIPQKLDAALSLLLARDTAFCFLVGGTGEFDAMAAQAVRRAKRREPQKQIALHLVLTYMENRLNLFPDEYRARFDEIYIPAGLADVYFKRAIPLRNRWMVDQAAVVVACVYRDFGGARAALEYARQRGKEILALA